MIDYGFSYSDLEYFLLVFVRISCFVSTAPFFSMSNVPRQFKAGFAFWVSALVYYAIAPHEVIEYSSIVSFSLIVMKEAFAGIIIGLGANICMSILSFAGKISDMEAGLSMVQLFDPTTREMTGFTGNIYTYAVTLILMVTNMHHIILKTFIDTYTLIPIGSVVYNSGKITDVVIRFLGDYISIAFRFCLPVVAALMILNALLGIMAKTTPQINMFAVGIQLKLLLGLSVMFLTVSLMPTLSEYIFKEMRFMMNAMIEALM